MSLSLHGKSEALSVLALLRSADAERELQNVARSISGVQLQTRLGGLKELGAQMANSHPPGVILLDLRLDDAGEMAALDKMMQQHANEVAVIATAENASLQGVRQLMRMGIPDFLPQPISREDLMAALEAVSRRARAPRAAAPSRQRRIVTFIKPCGGIGATSLAVQSACSLANRGKEKSSVCLLDLDLQFGNAALYLDVDSHLNLFNIIDAPDRLDGSFLRGLMTHHDSGVDILPGPQFVVPLDALNPDLVTRLLDIAASEYEYVVVDLPQAWALWTHAVLSHSNIIVFVTQLTVPALRQGRRLLETLRQEGLDNVPIVTVVNRYERSLFKRDIRIKEAEKALGRPIDIFVDNDYKTVSQALNQGVPFGQIRGGEKIEKQIRELVDLCADRLGSGSGEIRVATT
jgi:pilus assembly protein CpaE